MHSYDSFHSIYQYTQFSVIYTESNATTLQPSDYRRNPAYIHFDHSTESSPAALLSGQYNENPAYNLIDAQPRSHQVPTYEVIPSDTNRIPHNVQGTKNVNCNQNPAYVHLGVHTQENVQIDNAPQCEYSQNPAYAIHSNPN